LEDWSDVFSNPADPEFERLITNYLTSPLTNDNQNKGWKIPETTLVFPDHPHVPDITYFFGAESKTVF
jgi:hypothetical protein